MTNHVARARAWMSRAAVASALTVMPLAMAQAQVSLPTNGACDSSGFGSIPRLTPPCTVSQLGTANGINGTRILLTSPFTRSANNVDFQFFGNGTAGGSGSAAIGAAFSIAYSITVSGATGGTGNFQAILRNGSFQTQFDTGSIALTPGTNTGTRTGTILLGPITAGQTENLFTTLFYSGSSTPVTISAFDISFNPAAATAVPEPASAVVLAAGLIGLARMRRRRT